VFIGKRAAFHDSDIKGTKITCAFLTSLYFLSQRKITEEKRRESFEQFFIKCFLHFSSEIVSVKNYFW
jgi:hypothetical protein